MAKTSWHGQAIREAVVASAIEAVDELTAEAARDAASDHWWEQRSGNLEKQTITQPARPIGGGIVSGKFGSTQRKGFYGLFLEYKQPWLRPAADRVFPQLAALISVKLAAKKLP